jgi:predicted neuraminidase
MRKSAAGQGGGLPLRTPVTVQLADRPFAHCATLAELSDGSLLAAWFAGSYETAPDVAILGARHPGAGGIWSPPWVLVDVPGCSVGQPVFLSRPGGDLWLFFDVIDERGSGWEAARPYRQRSSNAGRTWVDRELLLDYPGLMFRSRPVTLQGRIVVPMYDENTWQSRMLISDDDGRSWWLSMAIESPPGNIHPTLVALDGGHLMAYLRPGGQGGVIWRTESADGGGTWSDPTPTRLKNPNSGFDLLRLQSGRLALAYNDSDRLRTPLCVALAREDERWDRLRTLEDALGEFSYPTLGQTPDGEIHMVYTYLREHIQYASFSERWLEGGTEIHEEDPRRDRALSDPL